MTAPHVGEDPYWLPALTGRISTQNALRHVAETRAALNHRLVNGLAVPQEVIDALDEGDRRTMYDPRRFLNIDTWTVDIDYDETTIDALEEQIRTETLLRVVETGGRNEDAIVAALHAGCPRHIVEDIVVGLIQ